MTNTLQLTANIAKELIDTTSLIARAAHKHPFFFETFNEESLMARLVLSKLNKLGCTRAYEIPTHWERPWMVDTEDEKALIAFSREMMKNHHWLNSEVLNDVDGILYKDIESADAYACHRIISELHSQLHFDTVGIVGRGHAVQGLADGLVQEDYTVIQCHSKTRKLKGVLAPCDVIVYAAPVSQPDDILTGNQIVLNVGRSLKAPPDATGDVLAKYSDCVFSGIGPLTIAILAMRVILRTEQIL